MLPPPGGRRERDAILASLREIVPVHEALGAGGLEQIGLLALARLLPQTGGQRRLVLGALLSAGEEPVDGFDRRRSRSRSRRVIAVADRLGRTRVEQLGPHLAEQRIRRIDVA